MNWSEMEVNWNEMKAVLHQYWPQLSNAVLDDIDGDRYELGRALQRHYGLSAEDAETAICEFEKDVRRPGAVK
jgi:hypothetical protein